MVIFTGEWVYRIGFQSTWYNDSKLYSIQKGIHIANKVLGRWKYQVAGGDLTYSSYQSPIVLLLLFPKKIILFGCYRCFIFISSIWFYIFPCGKGTEHWLVVGRGSLSWEEIGKEEPKETKTRIGHELVMFCSLENRSPANLDMFIIVA